MNRQRLLLAGLAGLLVLALAYAFWASPRQRVAPDASPERRAAVEAPTAPEEPREVARVRLELMRREGEEFAGYRRDIFNYPPPPAPPPTAPSARPPVPPSAVEPPSVSTGEVVEPPSFTFLGFVEKGEKRTVFLASNGEVFLVREGERFGDENEYRLSELTEEKLTIRYGEDERSIAIPITEPPLPSPDGGDFPPSPEVDFSDREGELYLPEEEGEIRPEDEFLPQDENDFATEEEDSEAMEAGGEGAGNNEEAADE